MSRLWTEQTSYDLTTTEGQTELPAEVRFPPAPWRFLGDFWWGLFRTEGTPPSLNGLAPLLAPAWRVVMLVRYLGGTRSYDELLVGALARRGWRPGLFIQQIWVSDAVGLWAGRRVWGLPKQMATFSWHEGTVKVIDHAGFIASISVNQIAPRRRPVGMTAPSFGRLDGRWLYNKTSFTARLGSAGMRINAFSARFPYQPATRPLFAFAAKGFDMLLPAPILLP
jgi:hypothetical protein